MLFQLITFCFLFITIFLFYIAPRKLRKYLLLVFSVFFIYRQGGDFGILTIALITALAYFLGLAISYLQQRDKEIAANTVAFTGIVILAASLFGWKYLDTAAGLFGIAIPYKVSAVGIPIGLSFYIFQAISYLADVKMIKTGPEKNPFIFAVYMMWFPKWMSGPIERAEDFVCKIEKTKNVKLLDFDRTVRAISYLLWGMFMKMVIADRVGIPVDITFENPAAYGAVTLILTSLLYTVQIYCDFAGYTNIMIGISLLFGIELTQNFKTPYFAENIVLFWRGWHISLSNFLRDYVYIPLGGNRKGKLRKAFNIIVVFLVCGMWHGAGLTFIIWGMFHGLMNVITNILLKSRLRFLIKGMMGRLICFLTVSFAWIFFRAGNMTKASLYIKSMLGGLFRTGAMTGLSVEEGLILGLSTIEWWIAGLSVFVLTLMDFASYKKDSIPPELVTKRWGDFSRGISFALIALVILIFGRYGAGDEIRSFVYAQF